MSEHVINRIRAERWRYRHEIALNTSKEIYSFLKEMGLAYSFHTDKKNLPTLLLSVSGSPNYQRYLKKSATDPYHELIIETFHKYRNRRLFAEVGCFGKQPVVVYRDVILRLFHVFGLFYQKHSVSSTGKYRILTRMEDEILSLLEERGGTTRREIRTFLSINSRKSSQKVTDTLTSLFHHLQILLIREKNEMVWVSSRKWGSSLANKSKEIGKQDAIDYLILRYLKTSILASRRRIKHFFKHIASVRELDGSINELIRRGSIIVDTAHIIDGKHPLKTGQVLHFK